jgi:hypothetical protein
MANRMAKSDCKSDGRKRVDGIVERAIVGCVSDGREWKYVIICNDGTSTTIISGCLVHLNYSTVVPGSRAISSQTDRYSSLKPKRATLSRAAYLCMTASSRAPVVVCSTAGHASQTSEAEGVVFRCLALSSVITLFDIITIRY